MREDLLHAAIRKRLVSAIRKRLVFRLAEGCDCGRPACRDDTWYATLPGTEFKAIGGSKDHAAKNIYEKIQAHIVQQQVLQSIWQDAQIDPSTTVWDLLTEENDATDS